MIKRMDKKSKKPIPNFKLEIELSNQYSAIAGVDEVGRGALAGPIVAGAVVFTSYESVKRKLKGVTDSKILTAKKRIELKEVIEKYATDFAIGEVSAQEIDRIGIGVANILAFKRALDNLKKCDFALIDGRKFHGFEYPFQCHEKGELKSLSIAAASIIAKVYRDNLMIQYAEKYSDYLFEKNVGYGSKKHCEAILANGSSPIHRQTFLKKLQANNQQVKLF